MNLKGETEMNPMIEPIPETGLEPEKRQGPYIIVGLGNPGRR